MGFRRVNAQKELRKAIEEDPKLEIYAKQFETQYRLLSQIVEYRKSAGITQKQIAKRSGLTQQMVSRMEKLDNSPTLENFLRYVLAIGLDLKIVRAGGVELGCGEEAATMMCTV